MDDTQRKLTDEQIEALAIEHEAFGFGRADEKGLTTHGFDPEGLRNFARAVLDGARPGWTERQLKVMRFALWRFADDARRHVTAAGQDREGKHYKPGAIEAFMKDAQDADELRAMLAAAPSQADQPQSKETK